MTAGDERTWSRTMLASFRAGERGALEEVYRRHAVNVARLLRHGFVFQSRGQARRFAGYGSAFEFHDALNETFRRAFEPSARQAYDGLRPYGPYVETIARNLVLQSFRAKERLFPSLDQAGDNATAATTAVDPPLTPEQSLHEADLRRVVDGFLGQLSSDDQRFIELRFRRGLSQQEVATELDIGRQRVRSREQALRRQLLRHLESERATGLLKGSLTLLLGGALAGGLA